MPKNSRQPLATLSISHQPMYLTKPSNRFYNFYDRFQPPAKWWLPALLTIFMLGSVAFPALAQRNKRKKAAPSNVETSLDTLTVPSEINVFEFPNINKVADYVDKSKLERIQKLEANKEWEALYPALKSYVRNFGVQNFYKDTYLIWRLAKLTELFDGLEEAKPLYKMVLRHHHKDINLREIELYYDSLNKQEVDLYVPLDYYYELVEHRKAIDTLRPPRGVLLNMGGNVNSRNADYGPTLNINGDILLFTSQRNEIRRSLNTQNNEDLFIARKEGQYWQEAVALREINTKYNEGSATLSRDGKTLYFARCDAPECIGSCDIFVAKLQADSTWGNIQNLGAKVNSLSWDSHPALSHTEDTLFFASDRIGGFGLSDIYFSYKLKGGGWAPAQNLGPIVNTRSNEVSPFFHPRYNILYFSSNGQLYNFGEFDIYKSYQMGHIWGEPVNIGPLVNGRGSEFYFTIDAESKDLFYARSANRDLNMQDLYSFPLPMEAQPGSITKVKGSLTDSLTGKPFNGIVSIIDLDDGIEVAPRFLKPDGSFEFDLINNNNYLLVIQGDDFFRIEEMFYLNGPMELNRTTDPIASKVKFESIEFENGKSDLRTEMYGDLNKIVNFLYDNPDFKLRISGHTDSDGSPAFNLALSKSRAQNIRDYMVIFGGVDERRVEFEGYGSSQPIVEEKTEQDKTLNRRVEFEIFRPGVKKEGDQGSGN
ncbi:MAG: OmpA family protein [Imperialibacter sp.]|uniref:OmpA family protein n=1 Tax=Imperialibacter sp. TaxID=2038411 RepID=UPI0032EE0FFF